MTDFDDLELNHSTVDDADVVPRRNRLGSAAAVAAVIVVAVGLGYLTIRRHVTQSQPQQTAVAPAAPQAGSRDAPVEAEPGVTLPPLSESDPLVRELVTRISSHPKVLVWLTTKGLIENFTVVTLNISEGQRPNVHLRWLAPQTRFRVRQSGAAIYVDLRSYERYNDAADAVAGLDVASTSRLYTTLKPRILDAYHELGQPGNDFDRVLERAIEGLLKTPVIEQPIELREKIVSYQFADADLESLSAAQKQFLRMGPRNMKLIQTKLREIAAALNLHVRT